LDISPSVVNFCNRYYNSPGLSFAEGRAEKIPFQSESYDIAVNVESARCYSNINAFFNEIRRILNPNGHFLFADMIEKGTVAKIRQQLLSSGFSIRSENEITRNVAKGLELDSGRREWQIETKIPAFLRKAFRNFAGTEGTDRFKSFNNGKFEYWSFVLVKN
jgi:ubiquinone/menaquinone biosynthesis C-methylase UbiE